MPVDIIRRLLQEGEAEASAKRASSEIVKADGQTAADLKEAERQRFVAQITEIVLKESGALEGLQRIKSEILIKDNSDLQYLPQFGFAGLVWGSYRLVRFPTESYPQPWPNDDSSYKQIKLIVDPDTQILTIEGQSEHKFRKGQWNSKNKVEEAIAKAFVNPISVLGQSSKEDRQI